MHDCNYNVVTIQLADENVEPIKVVPLPDAVPKPAPAPSRLGKPRIKPRKCQKNFFLTRSEWLKLRELARKRLQDYNEIFEMALDRFLDKGIEPPPSPMTNRDRQPLNISIALIERLEKASVRDDGKTIAFSWFANQAIKEYLQENTDER